MTNDRCFFFYLSASKYLRGSKVSGRNRAMHGTDMSSANRLAREVNCIVERTRQRALGIKTIHRQVGVSAS